MGAPDLGAGLIAGDGQGRFQGSQPLPWLAQQVVGEADLNQKMTKRWPGGARGGGKIGQARLSRGDG